MMIEDFKTFTLSELCQLVELPSRTVRYYIQMGLVDRPDGETRAASYSAKHLNQLLAIRKWQSAGLSLERIGDILRDEAPADALPPAPRRRGAVEVWSHLVLDDGIEIHLNPERAGLSPEQVRSFMKAAMAQLNKIRGSSA